MKPPCVRCGKPSDDDHHIRGRAGTLKKDKRFIVRLCRGCHNWAHTHITEARKLGLFCAVGKWNTPEK